MILSKRVIIYEAYVFYEIKKGLEKNRMNCFIRLELECKRNLIDIYESRLISLFVKLV